MNEHGPQYEDGNEDEPAAINTDQVETSDHTSNGHVSEDQIIVPDFSDLKPMEIMVPIGGKDYYLREANVEAGLRYRNAKARTISVTADGKLGGFKNPADVELLLVSDCLYEQFIHGKTKRMAWRNVPQDTIKSWPHKVLRFLFDTAIKISKLSEQEETVEVLEKRMASDKRKLAQLKNADQDTDDAHQGDHSKNLPDSMTDF